MPQYFDFLDHELDVLKKKERFRVLYTIVSSNGTEIHLKNEKLINFASNNYLGLTHHFQVKAAAVLNTWRFGTGSGASRLICGNTRIHVALEKEIARFKGTEDALIYPTGYMANLGAISTLVGSDDVIVIDKLNHASIVEACFLSKAKVLVYPHKDMEQLEKILLSVSEKKIRRRWVITESLFSMDGDIAPLPAILKLCQKYQAHLMIDEAHATGVLGKTGRGVLEHFEINPGQVQIIMGTLSKALGAMGGFIAGEKTLIDYLRNKSKSFIYTTALPASVCAAALKAVQILENSRTWVERLFSNIRYLHEGMKTIGLPIPLDMTPIIPIVIGDDHATMQAAAMLRKNGIFAPGIRPPTVPEGEGRIRISLTARHSQKQLDKLLEVMNNMKLFLKA